MNLTYQKDIIKRKICDFKRSFKELENNAYEEMKIHYCFHYNTSIVDIK